MKLLNSLHGLINEMASLGDVQDSIKKKKVMVIYYDGDDNGGKGYRTIEPVCVGYSKKGNLVL
jgi:predicted DNA-binding transcriptional regulator YafY